MTENSGDAFSEPKGAAELSAAAQLRSGTAARLAGLSPSTLRIWEHRYGVVSPPKTPSGQRAYSMLDVQRLRLIRRLTLEGHAIGTVAGLPHDDLVRLSSGSREPSSGEQQVLVVGRSLAQKLQWHLRPAVGLVFDDLDHAEKEVSGCGVIDVLVVHVGSLHASVTERVLALRAALPARTAIVIYSFGAELAVDALRAAGVTVRREPVAGKELARLIAASKPPPLPAPESSGVPLGPRLYSDGELVSLMEAPSRIKCECPRHLAEIVTLLVGFERYSAECLSQNEADAALHRHLQDIASVARTMFEQALARVAIDEGLVV
ncbi:MAG: MerR family transcriptional regulator [Pseudomonadota bacterium]|nr:MerR family transcriptional regulator [Pseudomonadota bacterium]